jgi:hydroxymethylpyrimidine/phosphomethylpyrimidine kinase
MEKKQYYRALTIAGSDSGGGAGIQADLKTFSALGCFSMSVITAITAQNTRTVSDIVEVPAPSVGAQLEAVLADIGVDAVKIGMLFTTEIIATVARVLAAHQVENIVVDPVMVAKSGDRLLRDEAMVTLRDTLIPMATVLTPNLPEAEVLTGSSIKTTGEMEVAARSLLARGPAAVLVKGGHLSDAPSDDCLAVRSGDAIAIHWLRGARIDTVNTHGTGCTLSSAIGAYLARGLPVGEAIRAAKTYIEEAIKAGADYAIGAGHGPVHHFHRWWQ